MSAAVLVLQQALDIQRQNIQRANQATRSIPNLPTYSPPVYFNLDGEGIPIPNKAISIPSDVPVHTSEYNKPLIFWTIVFGLALITGLIFWFV